MYFIFFSLLLAILESQAAPISKSKVFDCESSGGKYLAEVSLIRGESKGPYYEVSLTQKPGGELIARFPGARDEEGILNFKTSDTYVPGRDQSFEIEKGTGLWTKSQNLEPDEVLSFSCKQ